LPRCCVHKTEKKSTRLDQLRGQAQDLLTWLLTTFDLDQKSQARSIGLLGELLLFFQARDVRDYRVASIYEAEVPPLPASDDTEPE
jgi:hypothetical protein